MAITFRLEKGTPLTYAELDQNFRDIVDLANQSSGVRADLLNPAPGFGAALVAYGAAAPTNWNGGVSPPLTSAAIDQLAERTTSIEQSSGISLIDGGNF